MLLREKLVKLGRETPEMRKHLVPLLKQGSCGDAYKNPDGTFKGGKGERFDNCVKYFKECRKDVESPEGMCASIGREHGKIKAAGGTFDELKFRTIHLAKTVPETRKFLVPLLRDAG